jgi:tight adherence protein B
VTVGVMVLVVALAATARAAAGASRAQRVRRRIDGGAATATSTASARTRLPSPPSWLGGWLERAGVDADPSVVWSGWVGLVGFGTLLALLAASPAAAVLTAVVLVVAPVIVLRSRRGQGDLRVERAMPAALEAMARSLRSGTSIRHALGEAATATQGPLGRELDEVTRQVEYGATVVAALESLAVRRALPSVRLAVVALCLGVETGGAQARAVDGVAATLRDRLAVASEVRALSSQARMSALVIGLAPLAFGGFAIATDPRTGHLLFHTPLGLVLLAVGLALDGLGWLWMNRLTRVPG